MSPPIRANCLLGAEPIRHAKGGVGTAGVVPLRRENPLWDAQMLGRILDGQPLPEPLAPLVSDLAPLGSVTHAAALNLSGTWITNLAGITHITGLRRINLAGTALRSLKGLCDLQFLEEIDISFTEIADLSPLDQAPRLCVLRADYTPVSQVGELLRKASLKEVYLRRTKIDIAALTIPRRDLLVFVD